MKTKELLAIDNQREEADLMNSLESLLGGGGGGAGGELDGLMRLLSSMSGS